jgi:predicted pyridoxine 5'-phosphate oxidase superfamily flavin-nucleotide-binding protein
VGDELWFSTTTTRLKAVTVRRDPRIALTVLDEGAPFGFVTVEGTATIEDTDVVPGHIAVTKAMRGADFTPPEGFEERLRTDGRVIIKVVAQRVSGVTNRS